MKKALVVCLLPLSFTVLAQDCNKHLEASTPSARFETLRDGTVVDKRTGLMWMRCILGQNWNGEICQQPKPWFTHRTWAQAMQDAERSRYAGYDDWRLPTLDELKSIVEQRCQDPTINTEIFPATVADSHWTMDSYQSNQDYAWRINFQNGRENADIKENVSYVARLVRGEYRTPSAIAATPKLTPDDVEMSTEALKKQRRQHVKLWQDDIHDMTSPGMVLLQNPAESMADFTHNSWGRVDWMHALESGEINPNSGVNSNDPMLVIDLDIIMKDTGDMDYVRFPHRPHTQWLACSNCHPDPFPYREGLVKFSMNDVLVGKYCGKCHGKVSFSPMICDICHSVKKE